MNDLFCTLASAVVINVNKIEMRLPYICKKNVVQDNCTYFLMHLAEYYCDFDFANILRDSYHPISLLRFGNFVNGT